MKNKISRKLHRRQMFKRISRQSAFKTGMQTGRLAAVIDFEKLNWWQRLFFKPEKIAV